MIVWKDVPGYEGLYEASNDGFIRRTKRKFKDKRGYTINKGPKILKPSLNRENRFQVGLEKEGK